MSVENLAIPTQAAILAAGECSRFVPFNSRGSHKSTFELMGEPIITQTISSLKKAGVNTILVVHAKNDDSLYNILRNMQTGQTVVEFQSQPEPLGMGNALLEAQDKLQVHFLVVNPQQINIDKHLSLLKKMSAQGTDPLLLFSQETDEPQKYGMLSLDKNIVTSIVEKPQNLDGLSDQRILGIYVFNRDFLEFMSRFEISEYQLEEVLINILDEKK